MKLQELKKRVTYAVRALMGVPMIEDCPVPMRVVEKIRTQTLQARFEMYRPEADMAPPEFVENLAKSKLMEEITEGLEQSGLVQITQERTARAIIYRARVRVVAPQEED